MPPISFEVDPQKRLIIWRTAGRIAPDEVQKMRLELSAQVKLAAGWNAILDVRSQENSLSTEYVKQFAEGLPCFPQPVKWAVLVGTSVAQGMSNMLSILVEDKNVWIRVFHQLDKAEAWLAEERDER